ncbi:MAG: hypothetical protein UZ15_CFX003002876 [Chloroflexi bacterium OLB15]|nr:MAG: hypothetical protein UZ15_CFX003002876 [Chloroflexi bacterium OLB15]
MNAQPALPTAAQTLMRGMSVQHLQFSIQPLESIVFADQPGSALRGALYQALTKHFCSEPFGKVSADHQQRCPVCWLLAMENPNHQRGRDIPRPLTIEPPEKLTYHRGQQLVFGVSLVGQARDLLPYLARAVDWMGDVGVGRGRGRFRLTGIYEVNPLLDAKRLLMDGNQVFSPTLAVTAPRVAEIADMLDVERITLHFLTPARLVADGKLVKQPDLAVLIARLLERCQNLAEHYAEVDEIVPPEQWKQSALELVEIARGLRYAYNDTEWVEVFSGSKRQGRATPISGFVGSARWEGDLAPLRAWLVWGQSLHVGKDCVKGNGWYRIVR